MPTLFLPGSSVTDSEQVQHKGIACDNCRDPILGFRYKCFTCVDYDLCAKCESIETHAKHFMLRMPKPLKFKTVDALTRKWRQLCNSDGITMGCLDGSDVELKSEASNSSDDEPITKYSKHYDSGIDLSEDVKKKIRNEVTRVLSIKDDEKKSKRKLKSKRKMGESASKWSKKPKTIEICVEPENANIENVPEMVFVDEEINVKNETSTSHNQESNMEPMEQHLMHVKLSDDLTELMIEIPGSNEKHIYKY